MTPKLSSADPTSLGTPLLSVLAVDTAPPGSKNSSVPALLTRDARLVEAASRVLANGEFNASAGDTLLLHNPNGLAAERLLLVGAGPALELTAAKLRQAAGTAIRFAKDKGLRSLAILTPESAVATADTVRAVIEGAILADFDSDLYKSDRKDRSVADVTLLAQIGRAHV